MRILLLPFITLFLFSCSNRSNLQKLEDEIFVIHDEVMPKLGELNGISAKLKNNIDADDVPIDLRPEIAKLIEQLDQANSGMWDWMNQYKRLESMNDLPDEAVEEYLNSELERVTKVKNDINNSIKNGKTLLEKIGK